jgi:hypothetical protein
MSCARFPRSPASSRTVFGVIFVAFSSSYFARTSGSLRSVFPSDAAAATLTPHHAAGPKDDPSAPLMTDVMESNSCVSAIGRVMFVRTPFARYRT